MLTRWRDTDADTRWGGCFFVRTVATFSVTRGKSTPPAAVDLKLHRFDEDEPDVGGPFRSLVGHFM